MPETHAPSMDAFKTMLESMMAPVLARLGNLEGGCENYDIGDVEFVPVRDTEIFSDAGDDEEEDEEKIAVGAKPKKIQVASKGTFGIQKSVFSKGRKA